MEYSGPPVENDDILSVYVVINGSLNMSPGKVASQTFHGGTQIMRPALRWPAWMEWKDQGSRVVIRLAETEYLFNRVQEECEGYVQKDAGKTEVAPGSETVFVTIPYRRDRVPKILTHKKIQLY